MRRKYRAGPVAADAVVRDENVERAGAQRAALRCIRAAAFAGRAPGTYDASPAASGLRAHEPTMNLPTTAGATPPPCPRARQLAAALGLQRHPEGGHYAERFRATLRVSPHDGRPSRCGLTTIDFLLCRGEFSAWHRVASDEVWHLLEGDGVRLWLMPPTPPAGAVPAIECIELGPVDGHGRAPRLVVPAGWWQAAEPIGDYAYCGATVAPGFEFADFAFLRDEASARAMLDLHGTASARRLLG
jgi:hypothetical protein